MDDLVGMKEAIRDILNKLGSNATEVAESLRKAKVRGYRSRCMACPIARLLNKNLDLENLIVGSHSIMWGEGHGINTPGAIADFMNNFDLGWYEDLAL